MYCGGHGLRENPGGGDAQSVQSVVLPDWQCYHSSSGGIDEANSVSHLRGCFDRRRHGRLDAGAAAGAVQSRLRPDQLRSTRSASGHSVDQ